MAYIKRIGIVFSPIITLFTIVLIAVMSIRIDWPNQYDTIQNLVNIKIFSETITSVLFFVFLSILISIFWYEIGKIFGPSIGILIARLYGGMSAKPFLDEKRVDKRVGTIVFLSRFMNLAVTLFALDFLFSNSIFFDEFTFPPLKSFFLSLGIFSLIQPMNYILEDIGFKLYNESINEISSATSVLNRLFLRVIQTSSLIGSLVVISLNLEIIDDIPVQIRIIFVRNFFFSILVMFIFTIFFQPEPIIKQWKSRSIPMGKIKVTFKK